MKIVNSIKKEKILIVDDQEDFLDIISAALKDKYEVLTARNGDDCLRLVKNEVPNLVILDINMPGLDGYSVCQAIRNNELSEETPVIMISATPDLDDQLKTFASGADDFVQKPFKVQNLIVRVESKLSRLRKKTNELIVCGNLSINEQTMEVRVNKKSVPLSNLEFKFLSFFANHPSEVLDRNRILNFVWNNCHVTPRTIDTHISVLKKKLTGFNYEFHSIYGKGYVLKPISRKNKKVTLIAA